METNKYVFEYWEVKQYFKEDCEEWRKKYNYTPGQIVGRSTYEWYVQKCGYIEKIFIYAVIGEYMICYDTERGIKYSAKEFYDALSTYDRGSLDEYLTLSEMLELEEKINFVLNNLKKYVC